MAACMKVAEPNMKIIYNLTSQVGHGKANIPDNVMLVQVLINDLASS